MRIPDDAIIPEKKLTDYLLTFRPRGDKSEFLARAGFARGNAQALNKALRELVAASEAVEDGTNEYGQFFRVEGDLVDTTGTRLSVATIWLQHKDGTVRFVTLKPRKRR